MSLVLPVMTTILAALASDPGSGSGSGHRYAMQIKTSLLSNDWSWFSSVPESIQMEIYQRLLLWAMADGAHDPGRIDTLAKVFFCTSTARKQGYNQTEEQEQLRLFGLKLGFWCEKSPSLEVLVHRLNTMAAFVDYRRLTWYIRPEWMVWSPAIPSFSKDIPGYNRASAIFNNYFGYPSVFSVDMASGMAITFGPLEPFKWFEIESPIEAFDLRLMTDWDEMTGCDALHMGFEKTEELERLRSQWSASASAQERIAIAKMWVKTIFKFSVGNHPPEEWETLKATTRDAAKIYQIFHRGSL